MAVTISDKGGVKAFKKEPAIRKHLTYQHHVTDEVISTTNGEYLTIFKIRGRTHDCASDAELVRWHRDLNTLWRQVGTEHVRFWTHQHHREVHDYPETDWALAFPRMFDAEYRERFRSVPLMVNDLYLTVVYNPVGDIAQKMFAKLDRPSKEDLVDLRNDAINALSEISSRIIHSLRAYGIEQLGVYYRDERGQVVQEPESDDSAWLSVETGLEADAFEVDEDDLLAHTGDLGDAASAFRSARPKNVQRAYSTALEWLSFLANGIWQPVPITRAPIRDNLVESRVVSSMWGDILQRRRMDGVDYLAGLEVVDFNEEETEPGQFNLLMEADFEYVLTQSFSCMSLGSAQRCLSMQEKAMLETGDRSRTQLRQLDEANDDVTSRRFVMGHYHGTLHVWADTAKAATKLARKAKGLMTDCAVKADSIGLASEAGYYAMLPANQTYIPRPMPVNSWNFLCFSPFHGFMEGKPNDNPWGPAVTLLKTIAGTPLFFNWHVSPMEEKSFGKRPPGHTLFLGRTGAGKTTTMNGFLTQSTKFGARMICYDKDRGMYPLVTSLGGLYTVLREGEPTGWQPAQMKPTTANVAMVKRLVRLCAEITNGGPIEQLDVELVDSAVDHVMVSGQLAPELRSFYAIWRQIPAPARVSNEQRISLAELLKPWTRGHEHGWLFDNPTDLLTFDTHDAFGFDLTDFIVPPDQPAPLVRTPLLMYLFHRNRLAIDGTRRVIQVFDEFAQYLDDPIMDLEVKRGLKTDRKKDAIYVFATQEPNDALESRIGKTIVQQCVTKILLENPEADPDDYKMGLKLTDAEFQALLDIPENSRQFLVKQGGRSAVAMMDLNGMEKAISILSGTPDNSDRLAAIIEAVGPQPEVWLPKYWNAVLQNQQPRSQ